MAEFATLVELATERRHRISERLTIGRSPASDVILEDPDVNLTHAEITRQPDGTLRIRDRGSRNGTSVGGGRITDAPIGHGDEILVGAVRLRVELVEMAARDGDSDDSDELRMLRAVFELSRAIGVEHDLDRLLERVLQTCFQLLAADRGMIVTFLPGSRTPCATVARTRANARIDGALSTSVLSRVMASREPYLWTEIEGGRSESMSAHDVRSLVAVPLLYQAEETEWLGVIHLDSSANDNVLTPKNLELLAAIASQAALAIKNAMLVRQMQTVRSADWLRLERVIANLPVGVIVLDDERRCILVNEWVRRRTNVLGELAPGAAVETIAGISCDLFAEDLHEQITINDRTPVGETTLVIDAHVAGHEVVVVVSDITRERAQQAKAAHQDRLVMIGQLAGGIAHDFNNLLCVILNYAEMLEEDSVSTSKEHARSITDAATSAGELVHQLLTFSRLEVVAPVVIDVANEIAAREKLLAGAVGPGVTLTILRDRAEAAYVLIDRSQFEQIVMNLAVNARDAMNGTGWLAIAIRTIAESVIIEVTDTGDGMAPSVIARVFEPYFSTKARGKGTGLGLATVHGIVQHAQGTIEIRSQIGHGTTFTVTLPRTTRRPTETRPPLVASAARNRSILVVDDDTQVRKLTERVLVRAGYRVVAVESGPAALTTLRADGAKFDLVLTDVVMPGMSGRDLARTLETEFPALPVVVMSGYSGPPVRGYPFIAKPFDRATLLATLDSVFEASSGSSGASVGR